MLRYTDLLTSCPCNVEPSLTRLGGTRATNWVLAIAAANWTNRVNDWLQVPVR